MTAINIATLPGYYYLYALYFDYPINNLWYAEQEYHRAVAEALRVIQPAMALRAPYRKTEALRLFTERASLERFPPEQVDEAWRQLRELVDLIGKPADWPHPPRRYAQGRPAATSPAAAPERGQRSTTDPDEPRSRVPEAPFPKPPTDPEGYA